MIDQKHRSHQPSSSSRNTHSSNKQDKKASLYQKYSQCPHFQTLEEPVIQSRQQMLQQEQLEFLNNKGRKSINRPPTSKQAKIDKYRSIEENSSSYQTNSISYVSTQITQSNAIPGSHTLKSNIGSSASSLKIMNISKIPSIETSQINSSIQSPPLFIQQPKIQQKRLSGQMESKCGKIYLGNEGERDFKLDFNSIQIEESQHQSIQSRNKSNTKDYMSHLHQHSIDVSSDPQLSLIHNTQHQSCVTHRNLNSNHSKIREQNPLQNLCIPQHPKSIGKENVNRQRSSSKIRLNTRQFVKSVIQGQVFDLTYKDQIFSKYLKNFVTESEQFLLNNEKHYRIKFVMDLVQSLIASVQEYMEDENKNDRGNQERLVFLKEKEKLQGKIQQNQKLEEELQSKMADFEKMCENLNELRISFDQDKQAFITTQVQKYKQTMQTQSLELSREQMQLEDDRARLIREFEKIKQNDSKMNSEMKKIKNEQQKLSEDISEFIQIKEQFEKQRSQKIEHFGKIKNGIQEKFNVLELELKEKSDHLKKYEIELRAREKAITDLILNNQDICQNENLMNSFSKTLNSQYSNEDAYKNIDFDNFLGQFESHKDELMQREEALHKFLNRNDSKRVSATSIYTIESLRNSYQLPLSQLKPSASQKKAE